MKHFRILQSLVLIGFLVGASACQKDSAIADQQPGVQSETAGDRAPKNCVSFKFSGSGDLGCACMPTPLVCPPGAPDFCNFGAKAFPVTIGDYEGYMCSVVTGLEAKGNPPTGNGALQLTLHHYFVSADGQHAFWTEDQAVCAPGNNPSSCIVNDVLNIVGGCGDFEGAGGKFINHGLLTFDGGAEPCPIFYLGGGVDDVPTGIINFSVHGQVCAPGLD